MVRPALFVQICVQEFFRSQFHPRLFNSRAQFIFTDLVQVHQYIRVVGIMFGDKKHRGIAFQEDVPIVRMEYQGLSVFFEAQ